MEYIVIFFFSTLFMYLGEVYKARRFFYALSIILPALLAGLRDLTIGADTGGYPIEIFDIACSSHSLSDCIYEVGFFVFCHDVGYISLAYLISAFTKDSFFFFFITNLIVNWGVFFFLYKAKSLFQFSLWLGWLSYLFIFYNRTLNLSRQSIAIAIVLIAITYLWDKKYIKYGVLTVIALSFHTSAIITLMYFFEYFVEKRKYRLMFLLCLVFIIVGNSFFISSVLSSIPQLAHFSRYTTASEGNIGLFESFVKLLAIFYLLGKLNKHELFSRYKVSRFAYLLIIELLLFSCNYIDGNIGRIAYYFLPVYFIAIPIVLNRSRYRTKKELVYISCLIGYWTMIIVVQGQTRTFPYLFR